MQKTKVNQKHKDRLFLRLFQEKQALLSLYNAMNRSNYSDLDLLEITTLEDVLYIGIKNDVSFLIDNYMNLYEAQSTWISTPELSFHFRNPDTLFSTTART